MRQVYEIKVYNPQDAKNKSLRLFIESKALGKTATTYSPTVTQYHRRDWA